MYSALLVARYIIDSEQQRRRGVSNLRLQKLLYFVQAHFLVETRKPCFSESIEAWDFGPVVPNVYHEYKFYGSSNIPANQSCSAAELIAPKDRNLIDEIIKECAQYATSTLVTITHRQAPWSKAYHSSLNNKISNESILQFFEE